MNSFFDDVLSKVTDIFVPGQFKALYKAYRATAAVTFGQTFVILGTVQMNLSWANMMHGEFQKLKDLLLFNLTNKAFSGSDLGASYNKSFIESSWEIFESSVNSATVGKDGLLIGPDKIWDSLYKVAQNCDAVMGADIIPPTTATEAINDALDAGSDLANAAGAAVLAAAKKTIGTVGGMLKTAVIAAGAVGIGLILLSRRK